MLFGHFGDRIGAKNSGYRTGDDGIASTLIGLLPTYATIGVAAPILLSLLRFAQGLAIGGQWGGAMLLVTESAPADQRGYYGAYAQAGAPVGVILANLAFILISATVSEEFFITWGWRIQFIVSVVLIGIACTSSSTWKIRRLLRSWRLCGSKGLLPQGRRRQLRNAPRLSKRW